MEKRIKQVNVCFSEEEWRQILKIIDESAPDMAAGALIRLGWLYFVVQVDRRGILSVMADVMGA